MCKTHYLVAFTVASLAGLLISCSDSSVPVANSALGTDGTCDVEGKVIDGTTKLVGATVHYQVWTIPPGGNPPYWFATDTTTTDINGEFVFEGVPADNKKVRVLAVPGSPYNPRPSQEWYAQNGEYYWVTIDYATGPD